MCPAPCCTLSTLVGTWLRRHSVSPHRGYGERGVRRTRGDTALTTYRPHARDTACAPTATPVLTAPTSQTRRLRHTTVVKQLVQGCRLSQSLTPGPEAQHGSYETAWDPLPCPQGPERYRAAPELQSCCTWRVTLALGRVVRAPWILLRLNLFLNIMVDSKL